MKEFFKGWKRKVGCVTLVMACVFAAGWVRSQSNVDLLSPGRALRFAFISGGGKFAIVRGHVVGIGHDFYRRYSVYKMTFFQLDANSPGLEHATWFKYPSPGVTIRTSRTDSQLVAPMIPYWSLVTPLTLLSAWLLLSKRRPPKPASAKPSDAHPLPHIGGRING